MADRLTTEEIVALLGAATPGDWRLGHVEPGDLRIVTCDGALHPVPSPSRTWVVAQYRGDHCVFIAITGDGPCSAPNAMLCESAPAFAAEVVDLRAEVARLRAELADVEDERDRLRGLLLGDGAPPDAGRARWVIHDPHNGFDPVVDPGVDWRWLVARLRDEAATGDGFGQDAHEIALCRLVPVAWLDVGDGGQARDVRHPDAALAGLEVSDG